MQKITVLVVEDEPLVLMELVDTLEDAGFKVFEASNADDAVVILARELDIQLMFTDIDMPGSMDGLKLAAAVRNRWPPIQIIVTSGHHKLDDAMLEIAGRFFSKPYRPEVIVQTIRDMVEYTPQ